jgi:uncharacterized membrane protein
LKRAGLALWAEVSSTYSLRADERVVLEAAARTADVLAQLDEAMQDAPLTVPGSAGQLREHPLLSESRQQRATLARLLKQLELEDLEEESAGSTAAARSHAGRQLARQRWGVA